MSWVYFPDLATKIYYFSPLNSNKSAQLRTGGIEHSATLTFLTSVVGAVGSAGVVHDLGEFKHVCERQMV